MPFNVRVVPNPEGIKKIKDAVYYATDDFMSEATDHAKDLAFFGKYSTGETRQGLTYDIDEKENGVKAKMYTQSGHGGYVEAGTKKMKAEPFMWPAFSRTINTIFDKLKARLG